MSGSRWGIAAGLVAASCLIVRRLLVIVTVHGGSMLPTYTPGETLLGLRYRRLERGRTVVFRTPYSARDSHDRTGPPYRIKRVVALAGDPTPAWVRGEAAGKPIPAERLVVRGDAEGSEDSRHHGYIHTRDVLAVVVGRINASGTIKPIR